MMPARRTIQLLFVLSALVFTGVFLSYKIANDYIPTGLANDRLLVHFIDVKQGDACLINTPAGQNILIDGGPGENIMAALNRLLPWHERTIDLVILTHPHDDHVSGLIPVLNNYRVGRILYTGVVHTSPAYLEWLATIESKGIPLTIVNRPQTISLGSEVRLEIIYPLASLLSQSPASLNNSSIAARLVYRDNSFLFMGDAETETEAKLMASGADLASGLIKAGHHGSDTSSGEDFIGRVKPDIAVISVGKDNKFGHPNLRVIKRYERAGAKIYRTDLDSTVSFRSDGQSIGLIEK